jgi:hypothetical protein
LFAIVVFGTAVSGELIAAQMHRLRTIEEEVRTPDGVEDAGSPDPRLTPDERRRSLFRPSFAINRRHRSAYSASSRSAQN